MLLICLVVLIGTYTFLPSLIGNAVGKSIEKELELQNTPEVSLKSEPPPRMLTGSFAQGQVSLQEADFGGIRPRRVTIDLDPFELNVLESMGGGLSSREPLSGELRMEISQNEVTRIASSASQDVPIESVELDRGQVTVESGVSIMGLDIPVAVQGSLEILDQELVFEPSRVSAFGIRLPDRMADELLSESDFRYPLEDLPYEATVSSIEVKSGYLVLRGRLENIPLDAQSG